MITRHAVEGFKEVAPYLLSQFPRGVVFGLVEGDTMTWILSSPNLDIPAFRVGNKVSEAGASYKAIRERKVLTQRVDRAVYGIRLVITAIPILEEDGSVRASLSFAIPKLHPVAQAFDDFAPIVAEMFPEGAVLTVSDLQKFVYKQESSKFSLPSVQIGEPLKEGAASRKAIQTMQPVVEDLPPEMYGVPTRVMAYPLFDEEDASKVVGAFAIIIPRENARALRELSANLTRSLEEISSVVAELAASASQVHTNEQGLNRHIQEVYELSESINEVLEFIKEIADETKMLGLNAAIEAARAGDAGRGFGVVAEEIRKLSDQSKETVARIRELTTKIKEKVTVTTKASEATMRSSEEQAAATEEITASVEEVTALAEQLDKIAHTI